VEQNPVNILQQIMGGYIVSRCLHVAAELGVADVLDETPQTAAQIAPAVGAHPEALERILHLLAAHGIFQRQGNAFVHSPASRLLRKDHPQSLHAFVRNFGSSTNWAIYQELEYSIRTGLPASDQVVPGGLWAFRAAHPEANSLFNQAMVSKARKHIAAITAAYDFSGFQVIGDIAGGHGHLLRAVLDCTPTAAGVLFDQPHVIQEIQHLASERISLRSGDFFKDDLPACDAYMLMSIIHDWDDDASVAILKTVRRSAPPHARLLLIDSIMPDDPGPSWAKTMDIHMLTLLGGKQRTLDEYGALLRQAGFSLLREIDTGAGVSIVEAAAS
jgi:hypothetical protein